jgi:hypothetical protein
MYLSLPAGVLRLYIDLAMFLQRDVHMLVLLYVCTYFADRLLYVFMYVFMNCMYVPFMYSTYLTHLIRFLLHECT